MDNKQAIEQLKDLKENLMPNGEHKEDFAAIDLAIKALLEGTAQEVPVQEQPKEIVINIGSLSFSSEFTDYLLKCLINYQHQSQKKSRHLV